MSLGYLARIGAMCDPYAPPSAGPQTGCTPYTGPLPNFAPPSTAPGWVTPVLYVVGGVVLYKLLFARKGSDSMSLGYLARIGAFTSSDASGNPFFDPGNAAGASGDLSTAGSQLADSSQGSPFDFLSAPSAPPPSTGSSVASAAKSAASFLFGSSAPARPVTANVAASSSGLPSWLIPVGLGAVALVLILRKKKAA